MSGGSFGTGGGPADAGSFRGRLLSTAAPTNGQVLAWDAGAERWVPTTVSASSPTTTRGDLIRRGASADERFAALTANTFVGGDGTDVTVRTVAQVLVSLSGRVVDPLSGSGWTAATISGAAAATWNSGPARLSLTNPAAALGNEAYAEIAALTPDYDSFDLYARFDVLAGTSNDTWFSLRAGVDSSNVLAFDIRGNGRLDAYRTSGGSGSNVGTVSAGATNAPSTAQLASGNFWARISRRPCGVALSWGIGSSGPPDTWVVAFNLTDVTTLNSTRGGYVRFNTYAAAAVGGGFDVDVLDIRATGRGLGPL